MLQPNILYSHKKSHCVQYLSKKQSCAAYLNGLMGAPGGRLRGIELGLGSILDEGLACVLKHRSLVDQQARGVHTYAHTGDLLLDGVQGGNGLAEGLALLGVPMDKR